MAAVVVIQLAVAPLTLALAALFVCISRYGRWRPLWLIMPVMAGLAWVAAAGAGGAISSYLAAGSRLIGFLAHPGSVPPHLFRPGAALTDWQHRLPGQLPLALIIAAAEACAVGWSAGAGGYRPGLVIAARRAYLRAAHRRGEMATPGGGCVGTVMRTGRRAEISWREAQGGVLVTGRDATGVTRTALELATAAIQHRKTVIIIDLTSGAAPGYAHGTGGDGHAVAEAVKAACDGVHAPLAVCAAERGHYEPFSGASPDRAAGLLTAMIDWSGVGQEQWLLSADRQRAAFELLASRWPAAAGQRRSILDELAAQLDSAAPATRAVAAQLAGLRSAAIGAGLCQPGPGDEEPIILGRAVAERDVVLFALDRLTHGRWAVMVAQLVIADLTGILADRARLGARADCLLWINGFEETARGQLEAQLALGPRAGSAALLSTAAGAAAGWLAGQVNVVAVRGQPPAGSAARAASSAGLAGVAGEISLSLEDGQGWPAALLAEQRPDGLSLAVRNPRPRLVTGCRAAR